MSIGTRLAACSLALSLLLATATAPATPSHPLDTLVEVGGGELRWLGMEVYEARLLSAGGRFEGLEAAIPIALEITYRRNIPRDRLVRTTEREWNRLARQLGLPERARVNGWLNEVASIWPDVAPGDRIIAMVEPTGPTRFYGNDGLLGVIPDPEFGPAFLGIWLHPETRAADLRAELIGGSR
jgi:hypothetical protein